MLGGNMQNILQEVRVDGDTYITDEHNTEITTADVGSGFWLLGYDYLISLEYDLSRKDQ